MRLAIVLAGFLGLCLPGTAHADDPATPPLLWLRLPHGDKPAPDPRALANNVRHHVDHLFLFGDLQAQVIPDLGGATVTLRGRF